jgi:hypothetical protein
MWLNIAGLSAHGSIINEMLSSFKGKYMTTEIDQTWTELEQKLVKETYDGVKWQCFYRRVRSSRVLQVKLSPSEPVLRNPNMTWNGERLAGNCIGFMREHADYKSVIEKFEKHLPKLDEMKEIKATAGTPRKYRASINLDMWEPITNLGQFEGATWVLAKKKNESPRVVWRNYLLYPDRAVDNKATYYLAWNDERLSKNEHSTVLEEYRPELYNAVIEKLKELS